MESSESDLVTHNKFTQEWQRGSLQLEHSYAHRSQMLMLQLRQSTESFELLMQVLQTSTGASVNQSGIFPPFTKSASCVFISRNFAFLSTNCLACFSCAPLKSRFTVRSREEEQQDGFESGMEMVSGRALSQPPTVYLLHLLLALSVLDVIVHVAL